MRLPSIPGGEEASGVCCSEYNARRHHMELALMTVTIHSTLDPSQLHMPRFQRASQMKQRSRLLFGDHDLTPREAEGYLIPFDLEPGRTEDRQPLRPCWWDRIDAAFISRRKFEWRQQSIGIA